MNKFFSLRIIAICLVIPLSILVESCAVNPVTGKKEVMLMSEQQEIAMGQQSDPGIVAAFGLYDNPEMQEFINRKGKEMAAISHRDNLEYEFKILDSPVINAFAVPGGYVYFTRGILAHFNNEAEFAGVLGHEIGHITARHSAKQYTGQIFAQVGLVVGVIASPKFAQFADLAQHGVGLLFLKFSRDNESQSDHLGVEYSTKIGYDAHHMANFFKTLSRMRGDTEAQAIPTFMSTHPDPGDRFNQVHAHADQWQTELQAQNLEVNRNSYLDMIDGLVYGEDPRQGYVEDNVFYHPTLKFSFPVPTDWRTINSPSQVQIVPEDGKALILMSLAQETSLDAAADKVIEENKLVVLDRKNDKLNGMPAIVFTATQEVQSNTGQAPQKIKILTHLISYEGLIYKFHGLTMEADYNTYYPSFQNTMRNFKQLRDASKIDVKPERIKVQTVSRNSSLRSALTALNVSADRHEEIAILNSMFLDDKLEAGSQIKTVSRN